MVSLFDAPCSESQVLEDKRMQAYLASFLERDFDKVKLLSCSAFAIVFMALVWFTFASRELTNLTHLLVCLSHSH